MANDSDPITVFIDSKGRPAGTCIAGQEAAWLNGGKGRKEKRGSYSQKSSTEGGWKDYCRARAHGTSEAQARDLL